jgi:hypothetical protein
MQVTANVSTRNGLNSRNQLGCAQLRRRCVVVLNQQLHFPWLRLYSSKYRSGTEEILTSLRKKRNSNEERSSSVLARWISGRKPLRKSRPIEVCNYLLAVFCCNTLSTVPGAGTTTAVSTQHKPERYASIICVFRSDSMQQHSKWAIFSPVTGCTSFRN